MQKGLTLVTGGAGFIGSHSVEALLAAGYRVRVLDNFSSGKLDNLPDVSGDVLDIRRGDIRDRSAVDEAMVGVTQCLHLAAQVSVAASVDDPLGSAQHNILGFINVLEAARAHGVRRVVYASSAAVYGNPVSLPLAESAMTDPISPYGLEKRVDEQYGALMHHLYGTSSLGLRYFNVFGPRQDPASPYAGVISKFVEVISAGRPPKIFGDGRQTRDFVYVADIARANVAALESSAQGVCNVATGKQIDLLGLVDTLQQVMSTQHRPEFLPARAGDIRDSCGDVSRLRSTLGFVPDVTLAEGLERLVRSMVSA